MALTDSVPRVRAGSRHDLCFPDSIRLPFCPRISGDPQLLEASMPVIDGLATDLADVPIGILLADDQARHSGPTGRPRGREAATRWHQHGARIRLVTNPGRHERYR